MSKTRVLGTFMTSHCSERNLCLARGHGTIYCRNATGTPSCTLEYVATQQQDFLHSFQIASIPPVWISTVNPRELAL